MSYPDTSLLNPRKLSSITLTRVLSLLLTGCVLDSTESPPSDKDHQHNVALFDHLAVMLNTGRPLSQVVAVTGFLESEVARLTVVVSSDSTSHSSNHKFDIHLGEPTNTVTADEILKPNRCVHYLCRTRCTPSDSLQPTFEGLPSGRSDIRPFDGPEPPGESSPRKGHHVRRSRPLGDRPVLETGSL